MTRKARGQIANLFYAGSTPVTYSKFCARSIMENTLGYELSNGGSIPSGRTKYSSIVKWYNNRLITGHYKFDSCWRNQF